MFVDFVTQQAKRMHRIIFWSVACLFAVSFTFFQLRQLFRKKWYIECASWIFCLKHFLLLEELTEYYDKCNHDLHNISDMFVRFQRNLSFHYRVLRNIQILNFITYLQFKSDLLQSERQIWRCKFSKFLILRTRQNWD